jgi:hypothetical protein
MKRRIQMNGFQKHLNWIWLLALLVFGALPGVILARDSLISTTKWIGILIFFFFFMWPVSVWVIDQKRQNLWWSALFCLASPLWLTNKEGTSNVAVIEENLQPPDTNDLPPKN